MIVYSRGSKNYVSDVRPDKQKRTLTLLLSSVLEVELELRHLMEMLHSFWPGNSTTLRTLDGEQAVAEDSV